MRMASASAPAPKKRKRTEMTSQDKVDIIDRYRKLNAKSLREGADILGVSASFLCTTLIKEEELRADVTEGSCQGQRKRQRCGKDKETEDC